MEPANNFLYDGFTYQALPLKGLLPPGIGLLGVGLGEGFGDGLGVGFGEGVGVGKVGEGVGWPDGKHCEYHSLVTTHSAPTWQHAGPFHVFPPHCPYIDEHSLFTCCLRSA